MIWEHVYVFVPSWIHAILKVKVSKPMLEELSSNTMESDILQENKIFLET